MPPKKLVEVFSSGDSDSCDSSGKAGKRVKMDKDGKEYQIRRERNNVAVKKSREKSRKKAKDIVEKVKRLRSENEMLEGKVQTLSKELSVLKDLFIAHAGTVADGECCNIADEVPDIKQETVQTDHVYSVISKAAK